MPWHKVNKHSECPPGKPIAVVKDDDGSVAGCHASEKSADGQLAALYASEGKSVAQKVPPKPKQKTADDQVAARFVWEPDQLVEGADVKPLIPFKKPAKTPPKEHTHVGAASSSSCGCDDLTADGGTVLTTDVRSDGGGVVTETIEREDAELAKKGLPPGLKPCPPGMDKHPDTGKCVPIAELPKTPKASSEGDLGGKPNPGTKKDRRLKPNKYATGTMPETAYWTGTLVVEDTPTGDGREFSSGALTWADTPFPLRWNKEDSHGGEPRTVAVNVGRIDHVWREGNTIQGSGVFNLAEEDGRRAFQLVRDDFLSGVSVDPDNIADADVEYVWAEKPEGETTDDDMLKMLFGRPEKTIFHAGRIRAATLCDIPAFVEAYISLTDEIVTPPTVEMPVLTVGAVGPHATATTDRVWDAAVHDRGMPATMPVEHAKQAYAYVDEDRVTNGRIGRNDCRFIHHEVSGDGTVGPANLTACSSGIGVLFGSRGGTNLAEATRRGVYAHLAAHLRDAGQEPPPYRDQTISAALVAHAGGDDWRPPREWFADPKLSQLVPIIVTDEGRVYGHAAQWGECHLGPQDQCIMAPRESGHPYFMTGEVITRDGSRVPVGQIYTRAKHAGLSLGPSRATEHYEQTGYVVADVTVGNDRHGIWVAGAVRPDALVTRVNELRASGQISPDWRRIGGQLRMIGMLVVNVSGYQVPRPRARALNGDVQALVAAGVVQVGGAGAAVAQHRAEEAEQEALRALRDRLIADVHGGRD